MMLNRYKTKSNYFILTIALVFLSIDQTTFASTNISSTKTIENPISSNSKPVFFAARTAETRSLKTLPLHSSDPEQLVTTLRQYLSPKSSISYFKNQLIINSTTQELAKIKQLLALLDQPSHQLWISVRIGEESIKNQHSRNITASNKSTPNIVVSNSHKGSVKTTTRRTVSSQQYRGSSSNQQKQGVRATEGIAAFISTGTQQIAASHITTINKNTYHGGLNSVTSGFYATAWLNDNNTIRLKLEQHHDQIKDRRFTTQQLQSRVNGQLGEWILVGMSSDRGENINNNIAVNATAKSAGFKRHEPINKPNYAAQSLNSNQQQNALAIYLKVELAK